MIQLDPGERIVLEVRRHPFPLFVEVFFLVVFLVVPPLVYMWGKSFDTYALLAGTGPVFFFIYSAILLFAWIIFFIAWTNYYLDVLIVTDQRLIDIEQKRFFSRDMATLRLDKIEDVKIDISGFLPTMLDYGTLHIQTAAEAREFILKHIPHPQKTKDTIWELHIAAVEKPQEVKVVG